MRADRAFIERMAFIVGVVETVFLPCCSYGIAAQVARAEKTGS